MALSDRVLTKAAFLKLEMPGGDVRLCSGGTLKFDGEIYSSRHPVWGTVAEVPPIESALGDFAPGGVITMAPPPETPLSVLLADEVWGCRVRGWTGEVEPDSNTVLTATLLGDWIVDFPRRKLRQRLIVLQLRTRAERLFLRNRGNVCSPRYHKSVWPGEKGFDNCTDVPVQVAWGTQSTPVGAAGSSVTGGGGGGGIERRINNEQYL